MIYFKKKKIVFIKPRKVAGTSFEIALSKFADDQNDILTPISTDDEKLRSTVGGGSARGYKYSFKELLSLPKHQLIRSLYKLERPAKYYNHISAKELRSLLGSEAWNESFKITIVRNPYDRIISQYFYSTRHHKEEINFENWCRNNPKAIAINNQQYLIDGQNIIDFYIRYENLEEDIKSLELIKPELSGLWDSFKNINAKGNVRPKTATTEEIFSTYPETKKAVEFFCDYEIRKFNYFV